MDNGQSVWADDLELWNVGEIVLTDAEVGDLFTEAIASNTSVVSSVEILDHSVRAVLHNPRDPSRCAAVSRSGGSQFSLLLDGGFVLTHIDEDLTGCEERDRLQELLALAVRYVLCGAELHKTKILHEPYRVISDGDRRTAVYLGTWSHVRSTLKSWLHR